jgi:Tol biopolymer transport system component
MIRRLLGWGVVFVVMVAGLAAQQRKQSEIDLQAAIRVETVDGDLQTAIARYKAIADTYAKTDRATAAQALLRLAACYQTLGDAQAQTSYQRVVREFTDQKEAVSIARARLRATDVPNARLATRQLWELPSNSIHGPDGLGTVSPDGRYFSFVDWSTRNLSIHDFKTNQNRALTAAPKGEYAQESVISHDGKRVAYAWFKNDGYEIRVVDLNGPGTPRVLFANHQEAPFVFPYDWSHDGKWIAVQIRRADGTGQVALVSTMDGTLHVLETSHWRRASAMAFSVDDKHLAYDVAADTIPEQHDIYLIAIDARQKGPAVINPANDTVIGWTPDGSHLLFASDRSGSQGIWSLPVFDGRSTGEPQLIKADIRLKPRGMTRSGALFFSTELSRNDIFVSSVDLATGKALSYPKRIAGQSVGFNVAPQWSPDGASIAYLPRSKDASSLAIQSIATGQVRELRLNLGFIFDAPPVWSQDSSFLLVAGPDLQGRWGIHRVDPRTGQVTMLVQSDPPARNSVAVGLGTAWSPDGQTLYLRRILPNGSQITAFDMRTREERIIRKVTAPFVPSPDGRAWAMIDKSSNGTALRLETNDGAATRTLLEVNAPEDLDRPTWSPDSKFVVVEKRGVSPRGFVAVPIEGGSPRALDLGGVAAKYIRIHPDGRRIAVLTEEPKVQIWVMENLVAPR